MIEFLADLNKALDAGERSWKPPPRLSLSEWSDEFYFMSSENSAEPGKWRTLPYQREILDAITDPRVTFVSVMKSARVGYTLCVGAAIGYYIHQAPCPILVVQPTVDDAKGYSKENIAPMIRDCPVLSQIILEDAEETGPKDSGNTILHKRFAGGVLSMVGANSGTGFRRVSRKVVIFDEVDAYPPSAGSDGDQIKLGTKRSEAYWDRKVIAGSTPLVAGSSRIEQMFHSGDQRRFYVPCSQCGHMDYLVFREQESGGHFMQWPEGRPEEAYFVCRRNGCIIEHKDKRLIVERGEWRGSRTFKDHASFHIWAAYSYSPNATWGQIAKEFVTANKEGSEALRTFVNTVLGETWTERGESPEWQRIYQRRENYPLGSVPDGVLIITAGVDVQKDRLVYEVVGWGRSKESWSIDAGVLPGQTEDLGPNGPWPALDALLNRVYVRKNGIEMRISMLGVDSGAFTQTVYTWVRGYPMSRVMATKGDGGHRVLVGAPSTVDVTIKGQRIARGAKVWPIGVDVAKAEFYGWLRLQAPTRESGEPFPPGYCHYPEYGEEYFKQITAEQMVPQKKRDGRIVMAWEPIHGRENHWLDARVISRAAAAVVGLDRFSESDWAKLEQMFCVEKPVTVAPPSHHPTTPKPKVAMIPDSGKSWIGKREAPWLKRNR